MTARLLQVFLLTLVLCQTVQARDIEDFYGDYSGVMAHEENGTEVSRDLSVSIHPVKKGDGFMIKWKTLIRKSSGKLKNQSYAIVFTSTDRPHVFSSAMKKNVFGGKVPLDPLKGDPFVWARIKGDALTVFALLIDDSGEYQMQIYDRTLNDKGLLLDFRRRQEGGEAKRIVAQLVRR